MKVILHNALGEINDILKFTNNEREQTDSLELLLSLIKDIWNLFYMLLINVWSHLRYEPKWILLINF